jgi:uncharacterized protein
MGSWVTFEFKDARLRVWCSRADLVIEEVKRLRGLLDAYIARQPAFQSSLEPLELLPDAPEICRRMAAAALPCGVGPMAAVAGAVAQMCVEKAVAAGAEEAIVENGGDIYIASRRPVSVGLYAGDHPVSGRIALAFPAGRLPVSVCSSSSRFGHSMSFGDCDLATVVSRDGALADAAATLAGNSVKSADDVEPALAKVLAIPGVQGVLIIRDGRVGVAGDLPPLVPCADPGFAGKVFPGGDAGGSVGADLTR